MADDIAAAANRLSNALAALGTLRGDRVALLLGDGAQAASAHLACRQLGAVALTLAHGLATAELQRQLAHAAAQVAIVDPASVETLCTIRGDLPQLRHVIGAAGASGPGVHVWEKLLEYASDRYTPAETETEPDTEFNSRAPSSS